MCSGTALLVVVRSRRPGAGVPGPLPAPGGLSDGPSGVMVCSVERRLSARRGVFAVPTPVTLVPPPCAGGNMSDSDFRLL